MWSKSAARTFVTVFKWTQTFLVYNLCNKVGFYSTFGFTMFDYNKTRFGTIQIMHVNLHVQF